MLPDKLRPYHLEEALTVDPASTFTVDISTEKSDLSAAIQALINAYKSAISGDYPPDYATAEAGINDLAADILAAVADVPNPSADSNDGVSEVKTELEADIQAEGLTYDCPQCGTAGVIPTYGQDGVTPTGDTIQCPTCDGFGYTDVPYTLNNNSKTYVPA